VSWDGLAKIQTILETAAAALTPPITIIARGAPFGVSDAQIRWWYEGNEASPAGPDTLGTTQEGLHFVIGVYLPMNGMDIEAAAAADAQIEDADDKIQAGIWADWKLSGSAIDVVVGDSKAGRSHFDNGTQAIALEIPVTWALPDRHSIEVS
jgi:hypothetical protein